MSLAQICKFQFRCIFPAEFGQYFYLNKKLIGNWLTMSSISPANPNKRLKSDDNKNIENVTDNNHRNRFSPVIAIGDHLPSSDIGPTWLPVLEPQFKKEYYSKLKRFQIHERNNYTIYPPAEQIFSWTLMCPIDEVKVVLLGQDPYHGPNEAHGLAFSVQKGVKIPPSLRNIFKELNTDIEGFETPDHGDLTGWAKQGVLLLNSCLTVRKGQANSHKDVGWEKLTNAVVKWINDNYENVVFLLWGSYAQKKGEIINDTRHFVLKGVHPSPLSASKGFLGCQHFSKANEYLVKSGKTPIDWNSLN